LPFAQTGLLAGDRAALGVAAQLEKIVGGLDVPERQILGGRGTDAFDFIDLGSQWSRLFRFSVMVRVVRMIEARLSRGAS
jgi:hypothetical protein